MPKKYPTDISFIQTLIHLDGDEFTDGEVVDLIDSYCNLSTR